MKRVRLSSIGIFNLEGVRVFQKRTLFFKWNAEARRIFARPEDYTLVSDRKGFRGTLSSEPTADGGG
jgi:hypothetical protein